MPSNGARPFEEVRKQVLALIGGRTIVGHAISNEWRALRIDPGTVNATVYDTQRIPCYVVMTKTPPGLRDLAAQVLDKTIQQGPHCSVQDARVTMALYCVAEWLEEERNDSPWTQGAAFTLEEAATEWVDLVPDDLMAIANGLSDSEDTGDSFLSDVISGVGKMNYCSPASEDEDLIEL